MGERHSRTRIFSVKDR